MSLQLVAHWTWHREGWLRIQGYYDFAGSGVVHLTGGEFHSTDTSSTMKYFYHELVLYISQRFRIG